MDVLEKDMRIIARFEKNDSVRFVSHLDVQRLFHRAMRRAGLPIAYSNGFNPHPLMSFATALSVGVTSEAEWFDIKLTEHVDPSAFLERLNDMLPNGFAIKEACMDSAALPSLSVLMAAAMYKVKAVANDKGDYSLLQNSIENMMSGSIMVKKRGKGGEREVNLRPLIKKIEFIDATDSYAELMVLGRLSASESLNMDLLLNRLKEHWTGNAHFSVHRQCIYSQDGRLFPKLED
jgi:radical SAM-linked protein